ncbi:replication initiation factor domain-containing protein [Propionivibrio dicarboxylicus]|uniref:Phage replication initiation protein n=1 Tax=Propionivibrio dicarboxylicus TaxID=83767 RepID=A0A1G7WN37_9RHOO|nr:replication initiation factor domain-containing protein [Propionivibrio dicarboxylicus]SDG73326.1 phage replication initiation protein [Propionivibrio dicarboxylicus]
MGVHQSSEFSTNSSENVTGLGLGARIAAQAATVRPNEAGTEALEVGATAEVAESPRLVIRGENHSKEPNLQAAFVDWLNFTLRFQITGNEKLIEFDGLLRRSFGFGIGANRRKGHLNYKDSWVLGDGYGIFGTGGHSVAGTSLISLSGEGCCVIKDWLAVHDFIKEHRGRITRVDLAHDDYEGLISLEQLRDWYEAGDFHAGKGHPPAGEYVDDFGSGKGKTLYVGNRKNGKLLRIYEKGKQLGDPRSSWVRWEVELHNRDRRIPLDVLLTPSMYLAASYPPCAWISKGQSRIETVTRTAKIELNVLVEAARNSYGKLIWFQWKILELSPLEIVECLAVRGVPKRLDHAFPGEVS